MIKAYFDGSGKDDDVSPFVTIAGFAAHENIWQYFESEWRKILFERGDPGHMHMHRAIQRKSPPFEGWTSKESEYLIQGLIGLLREINVDRRFCSFSVTVDVAAHRKYQEPNRLPSIAEMCANLSFAKLFHWYSDFDGIITPFNLAFGLRRLAEGLLQESHEQASRLEEFAKRLPHQR